MPSGRLKTLQFRAVDQVSLPEPFNELCVWKDLYAVFHEWARFAAYYADSTRIGDGVVIFRPNLAAHPSYSVKKSQIHAA